MTARRLLTAPFAAALCLALLAAGCGDDGDDEGSATTTPTSETSAPSSETSAPSTEDTSSGGGEGSEAPVEEAPDVSWDLNAADYRGNDGKRIAFDCPAGGTADGSVWGTDVYTDDSSVCTAAVHAGLITTEDGGRVVVEIAPGEDSYEGSEANGVTSQDYGAWDGSFTFPPS